MKTIRLILISAIIYSSCTGRGERTGIAPETIAPDIQVFNNGNVDFDSYFTDRTMRVDYFHSGTSAEEHFAKDRVVSDGRWGGSRKSLIDYLKLGQYSFEVADRETKVLLFSMGFGSVFGEWQTIPEAKDNWGTFHESLRFPWPKKPVTIIVKKRNALNEFRTLWTTDIDPLSRQVNPAELDHNGKVDIIAENGPPSEKVDIVILGDGYSAEEMGKFRSDAVRIAGYITGVEPFKSRNTEFNIRAVETPAGSSGVNKPHLGVFTRTPLSVHYSSFDSERYALTYDNRTVRDVASQVPYDLMIIMINERTYGGGGIYNLYSTVAVDNKFAEYLTIHEFGHNMAALADEYYTSAVSYDVPRVTVEPWETNITAFFDKSNLKWKDLVDPGTPLPTPWNKEEFDRAGYRIQKERDSLRNARVPESVMEDLFTRQMSEEDAFFEKEMYRNDVGAFEGAGYLAVGLYRPQIDCIMYTRHMNFCKVCRRSIDDVINSYIK
jgi:hypothetical protein